MDWDCLLDEPQTPHACLQRGSSFQDSLYLTHTQPWVCSAAEASSHRPAVSRTEPKQRELVLGIPPLPERKPSSVSSQDLQARLLTQATNFWYYSSPLSCQPGSNFLRKNPTAHITRCFLLLGRVLRLSPLILIYL